MGNQLSHPLLAVFLDVAAGATELAMGRRLLPKDNKFHLWAPETDGPNTSQYMLDPYSVTHLEHGLLLYALFLGPMGLGNWSFTELFNLASLAECLWEVVENSDWVIRRYRTVGYVYDGDTVLNSQADIWCAMLSFWAAYNFVGSPWKAAGLAVLVDGLFWLRYKDSLFQNIIHLVGGKN